MACRPMRPGPTCRAPRPCMQPALRRRGWARFLSARAFGATCEAEPDWFGTLTAQAAVSHSARSERMLALRQGRPRLDAQRRRHRAEQYRRGRSRPEHTHRKSNSSNGAGRWCRPDYACEQPLVARHGVRLPAASATGLRHAQRRRLRQSRPLPGIARIDARPTGARQREPGRACSEAGGQLRTRRQGRAGVRLRNRRQQPIAPAFASAFDVRDWRRYAMPGRDSRKISGRMEARSRQHLPIDLGGGRDERRRAVRTLRHAVEFHAEGFCAVWRGKQGHINDEQGVGEVWAGGRG